MTRAFVIVACAASVACASANPPNPEPADRVIATTEAGTVRATQQVSNDVIRLTAPPAAAMAAAASAYKDLGVEVKLFDPPGGHVGNRSFSVYHRLAGAPMSTFVGCGQTTMGPGADSYRVTISLVTTILPDGPGSTAQTTLEAKGDDPSSSQGALSCLTTGILEQRVNALIATKAAQ